MNIFDLPGNFPVLSLQLYSWYIQHGVARNEKDEIAVKEFFEIQTSGLKSRQRMDSMRICICTSVTAGLHLSVRIFFLITGILTGGWNYSIRNQP